MRKAPENERAIRLRVEGVVQGVGYRAWTLRTALSLGLKGSVQNREDGTVEIVAQGPLDALEELVSLSHEGPPLSEVKRVSREDTSPSSGRTEFVMLR